MPALSFVFTRPGQMELERMLSVPHSAAWLLVSILTAALVMLYTPRPGLGLSPSTLLILMMDPPPRFRMCTAQRLDKVKIDLTLTAIILSKSVDSIWSMGPNIGLVAAEFTKISTPPYSSTVFSTRLFIWASSLTLHSMPRISMPCALSSWAKASRASCLRLQMTTLAPCSASPLAIAAPMPLDAPVTMATLPWRSNLSRNFDMLRNLFCVQIKPFFGFFTVKGHNIERKQDKYGLVAIIGCI